MELIADQINIDLKLSGNRIESVYTADEFDRCNVKLNSVCSLLVDFHKKKSTHFNYFKIGSTKKPIVIQFPDYKTINLIQKRNEIGLFLKAKQNKKKFIIWLPHGTFEYKLDRYQRISEQDKTIYSYKWEFFPHLQLYIYDSGEKTNFLIIPFIIFEDNDNAIFDEFSKIDKIERVLLRKSNWFYARKPSDIWKYLIHGSVYDPRSEKNIGKRFKCQQCAYAWWNYFGFLYRETKKKLYAILQDEIAFTVLMDLSSKGEWGHGFWSDEIETHTRFHLDGIHLLLSQYEKTGNTIWSEAADKGMKFVLLNLAENLSDGSIWFLHDSMESKKLPQIKSTVFGKSYGNSLCINTHVQALTVLSRLKQVFAEDNLYVDSFEKGLQALRTILDHQPADFIYIPLSKWIRRYKTTERSNLIYHKIVTKLQNLLLRKIYWFTALKFPRLVHPNGFVERDLTLSFASDRYHVTNIKDFLTLYHLEPLFWLKNYIIKGTTFLRNFIKDIGLESTIERSPYYIEFIDILYLYDKLIEPIPIEEINTIKDALYNSIEGCSLDFEAFDLIHKKPKIL